MNYQNNQYGNKQNLQTGFNHNSQNRYTSTGHYNQGNQYSQNMTPGQYGQQQTGNQTQYYNQPVSQQTYQQVTPQQPKMIKNPEKNIVHSPEMNDRDYLNDILATEKYLTDGLNTFTREASYTELYNDVKNILNETHDCARNLFDLMFKDGFYSFQGASGQEIQQTQQKFSQYLSQQDPYGTNNM